MLIADGQETSKASTLDAGPRPGIRARDAWGLALVAACVAAMIAYRSIYIEPRGWGAACASASAPLACLPRAGLLWMQRYYLWGAGSLACGLWAFLVRGGFGVQLAAILLGIGAVENYNATWGASGAALGAWAWLRRQDWPGERRSAR